MRAPYTDPQRAEREFDTTFSVEVEKYERCQFCSTKLIFNHDLNLSHFQVIETGRCPGCGVTLNPKKYTLQ
jgi:hypothetical protein